MKSVAAVSQQIVQFWGVISNEDIEPAGGENWTYGMNSRAAVFSNRSQVAETNLGLVYERAPGFCKFRVFFFELLPSLHGSPPE